jgi:hypothetical protein
MCLLDNQAIMSVCLILAHGTISIETKWTLALSITEMNLGSKCARQCLVNHIFKPPELISP